MLGVLLVRCKNTSTCILYGVVLQHVYVSNMYTPPWGFSTYITCNTRPQRVIVSAKVNMVSEHASSTS
jgi:hypothetical protein